MNQQKRLRVFAGPNGSGKTSLVKIIQNQNVNLGTYVNADEIKVQLDNEYKLNFDQFSLTLDFEDLLTYIKTTTFFDKQRQLEIAQGLSFLGNSLQISDLIQSDDWFSTFLADYIRNQLLIYSEKFTIETVMSHPSKLDFLSTAKQKGFKIYLYFVSLEDPKLNIDRVKARVKLGGHHVPSDKIIDRYPKTLNNLLNAIRISDKSYIFDNSGQSPKLIAASENDDLTIISDFIPLWFQKSVMENL